MPIYTRTGDRGQTSLFSGQRISKSDLRVEAYGTIDELNSVIGVVISEAQSAKRKAQNYNSKLKTELTEIQNDLFDIGSALASPRIKNHESGIRNLDRRVKEFEKSIDDMTDELPALSNFILPGGGKTGALLHFARTVARRAERKVVALNEKDPLTHSTGSGQAGSGQGKVDKNIIMYLNRLSDLLFTMARFVNYKEKNKEIIWKESDH